MGRAQRRSGRIGIMVVLGSVLGVVVPSAGPSAAATPVPAVITACSGSSQTTHPLTVTVDGQPATGLYVLPHGAPRGIVVVGHGNTADAQTVAGTTEAIASADDVIALAMNYRGTNLSTLFGWQVIEGAQDSIAATQLFDRACPGSAAFINSVLGESMGGNMSGIAVSSGARRADGQPLYNYWFDVSGVTNVVETYADAQAISLAPIPAVSSIGSTAVAEMRQEFGGTPLTNPLAYLAASPVMRATAMKSSGLEGVVVAHGVLDGEVTSDQSVQMVAALVAAGVPVDFYTSVFKAPDTASGQTIDGYLSAFDSSYVSPFAGHVSTIVLDSALDAMQSIYAGGPPPDGTSITLNDGTLGLDPLATIPGLPALPSV